jgi:hypothetical protein
MEVRKSTKRIFRKISQVIGSQKMWFSWKISKNEHLPVFLIKETKEISIYLLKFLTSFGKPKFKFLTFFTWISAARRHGVWISIYPISYYLLCILRPLYFFTKKQQKAVCGDNFSTKILADNIFNRGRTSILSQTRQIHPI